MILERLCPRWLFALNFHGEEMYNEEVNHRVVESFLGSL